LTNISFACVRRAALMTLPAGFAVLLGCGSGGANSGTQQSGPTSIGTVQISPSASAQSISPNFMSLAQDLSNTTNVVGGSSTNMNPIYEQLIRNLTHYGNGPMLMRLLGDDNSGAAYYDAMTLSTLYKLHQDLGVDYFVGVDFSGDDVSIASTESSELAAGLPGGALQGIELGNEPDLYESTGYRDSSWGYSEYLSEYKQFAPAIIAASGGIKLAAPVWSSTDSGFMDELDPFIADETSTLSMVVIHHYPGTVCGSTTEPADYLLSEIAVDGDGQPLSGPDHVQKYVTAGLNVGLPLRIGELNSISCHGQAGVSNSFSSALWAMDVSFAYANLGVAGVNFFEPGESTASHPYTPFDFTYTTSGSTLTYKVGNINPLYYGMLMFTQAVQNSAKLLPVTLTTNANIKAWATMDSGQTIRLLLLNKDESTSGPIAISLSGYGQATVTRLTAPSYSSTTGVTLGGQTFDGSPDGTLQGTATSETVQPVSGVYTVNLPDVSAALLTIQP